MKHISMISHCEKRKTINFPFIQFKFKKTGIFHSILTHEKKITHHHNFKFETNTNMHSNNTSLYNKYTYIFFCISILYKYNSTTFRVKMKEFQFFLSFIFFKNKRRIEKIENFKTKKKV